MKDKSVLFFALLVALMLVIATGCPNVTGDDGEPTGNNSTQTYQIIYDGNGHSDGSPPINTNAYDTGSDITVADPGDLARTGYAFTNWNTISDGSGDMYAPGEVLTVSDADVTLYAQWSEQGSDNEEEVAQYTVTYDGNGFDGGELPVDDRTYEESAEVIVAGSTTFSRADHTFVSWNTVSTGEGTDYEPGETLVISDANVVLYAQWETEQAADSDTVRADIDASKTTAVAGEQITFSVGGDGDSGSVMGSYSWSFGDGSTATGSSVTHSYEAAGSYTVTLTATDSDGNTVTNTVEISVNDPPEDATASLAVTITFNAPSSYTIDFGDFDGTLSPSIGSVTVTSSLSSSDTTFEWYLDGAKQGAASDPFYELMYEELSPGRHDLTLVANRNGRLFSGSLSFTVEN